MIFGTWTICSRTTSTSCCVTCSKTSHRRPGILIQAGVFTLATFNYSQKMLWKCWENWEHLKPPARNMCGWGGVPNICVPGLWHFHHFVDDLHLRNLLFFHYLLDGGDLHDLLNLLTWKHETARATQSTHCIACTQSSLHFCCSEILHYFDWLYSIFPYLNSSPLLPARLVATPYPVLPHLPLLPPDAARWSAVARPLRCWCPPHIRPRPGIAWTEPWGDALLPGRPAMAWNFRLFGLFTLW